MSEASITEIVNRLDRLQASVDTLDDRFVSYREYQADARTQATRDKSHDRRLHRLEESNTWLMRGLAGLAFAMLVQVVVAVVALGGVG